VAEQTVVHSTFVITRIYPKPVGRVFAAFSDPAKKRRWYGESRSHDLEAFETEFRIGGIEHTVYRFGAASPFPGAKLVSDGRHVDIVTDRRVVLASTMAMDGRIFSASLTTFELLAKGTGTELVFTHQGAFFEGADGPKMREAGWRLLLDQLGAELAW
jgi:uncharacterized protein YndB with AHSA1/START domain